jgi:thioredoxin-related protein
MLNRRLAIGLLICSVLTMEPSGLGAAGVPEVQWRINYTLARKEALTKNRPLLLDFGTEQCFWCRRLEAITFRDARVVDVLNEHFIPLKVDAEREPRLTEALHIQSYPTLVLAAPDGKIVGTLEGFLEAGRLHDHLQRVLVALGNPEWMVRDYQEAAKAIAASDYARAIALLKSIVADGHELPVQVKAKQVLRDLEQQAAGRLAQARQLAEKGETARAIALLSELLRAFAGTQAATESGELLAALTAKPEVQTQVRLRQAREVLAQAREDYRTQQYLCCLDRCERLATNYADLPEGVEGEQLANQIKNNPEWLQQACDTLTDRLSALYLALAETCIQKNEPLRAARYLERILQAFPGTPQAETARVRLSALQGRATWQAEFKRP